MQNSAVRIVIFLLSATTSLFVSAADNKPNTENTFSAEPLLGLDEELDSMLMKELITLGYTAEHMSAQAKKITSMEAGEKKDQEKSAFYAHYQQLAKEALYRLSARTTYFPEVSKLLDLAQIPLPTQSQDILPSHIFLIYQQLDGSVTAATLGAGITPCLTWRVRLSCLLSSLAQKECGYIGDLVIPLAQQSAPVNRVSPVTDGHEIELINWVNPRQGYTVLTHEYQIGNFEHDGTRPSRASFSWPLSVRDLAMCVEIKQSRIENDVLAEAYLGYASASAHWWLSLNGVNQTIRPGPNETDSCTVSQTISSRNDLEVRNMVTTSPRACWFRGLPSLYRNTFPLRPFPQVVGDSDTTSAARVEITSNISTAIVRDGIASGSRPAIASQFTRFGVLVLRQNF